MEGTMNTAYEDDDLALPLLRRSVKKAAIEADDDTPLRHDFRVRGDRLRPGTAGAFMGLLAGAAGLGVVHAMHPDRMGDGMVRAAASLGVPADAAIPLAYLAAAIGGAVIGAGFASVTQHLRRFVPLLVWAEIFFVSLTMLALALSSAYGRGLGVSLAPAILAASGVFAFVASFQLPLRQRR
jgi:multidrug transporter EmrE-like cation transporter